MSVAPDERETTGTSIWSEYAESAAENPAQDFRRRLILRLLAGVSASSRVLDIGSGTGDLAASLREAYPSTSLLGLELSADEPPPPEYRSWATDEVCSEMLEHVDGHQPGDPSPTVALSSHRARSG